VAVDAILLFGPIVQGKGDPAADRQKIFGYIPKPVQVMAFRSIFEDQQMPCRRFCQAAFTPHRWIADFLVILLSYENQFQSMPLMPHFRIPAPRGMRNGIRQSGNTRCSKAIDSTLDVAGNALV
jgi:hypothetical protein